MNPSEEIISSQEKATAYCRDIIQRALDIKSSAADTEPNSVKLVWDALTTKTDQGATELMYGDFVSKCGPIVGMLQKRLTDNRQTSTRCWSSRSDRHHHFYLTKNVGRFEVLIDPTIGQNIVGYNNVFVGSREELKDIVVNQTGKGKTYQLAGWIHESPPEAFERIWGSVSVPR